MKLSLFAIAALMVTGGAFAGNPNGVQVYEVSIDIPPLYVDCLGESIGGHSDIEAHYHQFVTP